MYFKKIKFLILFLVYNSHIFSSNQLEFAIEKYDTRLFFNILLAQAGDLSDAQVHALLVLANNKKIELKRALDLDKKTGIHKTDKFKAGFAVSGIALSIWFTKNSLWSPEWTKSENSIFNIIFQKFSAKYKYRMHDANLTPWTMLFALFGSGSIAYLCSADKVQLMQDNLIKINAMEYILKKSKTAIDRLEISRILDGKFVKERKSQNLYLAGLLGILSADISLYSALTCDSIFDNVSIFNKMDKKISRIKLQASAVAAMTCAAVYYLLKDRLQSSDSDDNLSFYKELAGKNV